MADFFTYNQMHTEMASAWHPDVVNVANIDPALFIKAKELLGCLFRCMCDSAKALLITNPEFALCMSAISVAAFMIVSTTHAYIQSSKIVPGIKTYLDGLMQKVLADVNEASKIMEEAFDDFYKKSVTDVDMFVWQLSSAAAKLNAAQELLIQGKTTVTETVNSEISSRNVIVDVKRRLFVALTILSAVVAFIFSPEELLKVAGSRIEVGLGVSAVVCIVTLILWVNLWISNRKKTDETNMQMLQVWQTYDLAKAEHAFVQDKLSRLMQMVIEKNAVK